MDKAHLPTICDFSLLNLFFLCRVLFEDSSSGPCDAFPAADGSCSSSNMDFPFFAPKKEEPIIKEEEEEEEINAPPAAFLYGNHHHHHNRSARGSVSSVGSASTAATNFSDAEMSEAAM